MTNTKIDREVVILLTSRCPCRYCADFMQKSTWDHTGEICTSLKTQTELGISPPRCLNVDLPFTWVTAGTWSTSHVNRFMGKSDPKFFNYPRTTLPENSVHKIHVSSFPPEISTSDVCQAHPRPTFHGQLHTFPPEIWLEVLPLVADLVCATWLTYLGRSVCRRGRVWQHTCRRSMNCATCVTCQLVVCICWRSCIGGTHGWGETPCGHHGAPAWRASMVVWSPWC